MGTVDAKVQARILQEIIDERLRQDKKFGERNDYPPERWLVILMEEVGEVSNAVLEHDLEGYYNEFVQVAAVAVAALEGLCRELAEDVKGGVRDGRSNGRPTKGH